MPPRPKDSFVSSMLDPDELEDDKLNWYGDCPPDQLMTLLPHCVGLLGAVSTRSPERTRVARNNPIDSTARVG